jgi:hypothetical protein
MQGFFPISPKKSFRARYEAGSAVNVRGNFLFIRLPALKRH